MTNKNPRQKDLVEMITPEKEIRLVYPEDVEHRIKELNWKKSEKKPSNK